MIIDCVSDLHGQLPELEGGDMLIVAGDITANNRVNQWVEFYKWFEAQKYKKKIYIAGNHDGFLRSAVSTEESKQILGSDFESGLEYLIDCGCEYEGLKIWGSPWTPKFCNWYFMKSREEMKEVWEKVPDDIDILITHGPAWGILDKVYEGATRSKLDHLGCVYLRQAVERIKPKLHVFGHIHGSRGMLLLKHEGKNTICVNAAMMSENYDPIKKAIRVEL